MLLCAALVDLWYCWPAGADIDAYEFLVYLVVLGVPTLFWYAMLVLFYPALRGLVAGLLTGILADLSLVLLAVGAYWGASSHPASPSSTNAILGLELSYAFAYLMIFLVFASWRILLVYAIGGWLAERLMRVIPRAR